MAMPSSTFFNLQPEKRERLLAAAREGFARASFDQVSINRMIRRAGIPRGSFYMYFTGKEELFSYLMEEYRRQAEEQLGRFLEERSGELFEAFLDLFDYVHRRRDTGPCREMLDILRQNPQMRADMFLLRDPCLHRMDALRARINTAGLDLREEGDLDNILYLLIMVTAQAAAAAGAPGAGGSVRSRLIQIYDILRRGAENAHVPDAHH